MAIFSKLKIADFPGLCVASLKHYEYVIFIPLSPVIQKQVLPSLSWHTKIKLMPFSRGNMVKKSDSPTEIP